MAADKGPQFIQVIASLAANYSGGALPVNGDRLVAENFSGSILFGLEALSGVDLAALTIRNFSGTIGLAAINPAGYAEYRPRFFKVGAALVNIAPGTSGNGRINIDFDGDATECDVLNSGSAQDSGIPAVQLKNMAAGSILRAMGGSVGLAFGASDTGNVSGGLIVGDATVNVGPGATVQDVLHTGNSGQLNLHAPAAMLTKTGDATLFLEDGASLNSLAIENGTAVWRSGEDIDALAIGSGGVLDVTEDGRQVEVGTCTLYAGCQLQAPHGNVTFNSPIELIGADWNEVDVQFGRGRTISVD